MTSNRRLADYMAILANGVIADIGSFNEILNSKVPAVTSFMSHAVTERLQRSASDHLDQSTSLS